jgi:hypothetical protein
MQMSSVREKYDLTMPMLYTSDFLVRICLKPLNLKTPPESPAGGIFFAFILHDLPPSGDFEGAFHEFYTIAFTA